MIIAIDGPAGAGKSTIAKSIAKKLGLLYIDTGAMYRALTLKVLETSTDISDTDAIIALAKASEINLINSPDGSLRVVLDGKDVSREIREPRITKYVSLVSKIKDVRKVMLELQRGLGSCCDSVLDGRDIGTVVFPDAEKKFYLDAGFKERVRRRYEELKGMGQNVTSDEVAQDLANRDKIDSTREFAPLKKADDAIYVDTSDMTVEEVINKVLEHISA